MSGDSCPSGSYGCACADSSLFGDKIAFVALYAVGWVLVVVHSFVWSSTHNDSRRAKKKDETGRGSFDDLGCFAKTMNLLWHMCLPVGAVAIAVAALYLRDTDKSSNASSVMSHSSVVAAVLVLAGLSVFTGCLALLVRFYHNTCSPMEQCAWAIACCMFTPIVFVFRCCKGKPKRTTAPGDPNAAASYAPVPMKNPTAGGWDGPDGDNEAQSATTAKSRTSPYGTCVGFYRLVSELAFVGMIAVLLLEAPIADSWTKAEAPAALLALVLLPRLVIGACWAMTPTQLYVFFALEGMALAVPAVFIAMHACGSRYE